MKELLKMKQRESWSERFPIWLSSVDYESFVQGKVAAEDVLKSEEIDVKTTWKTLDAFLGGCVTKRNYHEELMSRETKILSNNDKEYRLWAVEIHANKVIFRMAGRRSGNYNLQLVAFLAKQSTYRIDFMLHRHGYYNVASGIVVLASLSAGSLLGGEKHVLAMYSPEIGHEIVTDFPEATERQLDFDAIVGSETKVDIGYLMSFLYSS